MNWPTMQPGVDGERRLVCCWTRPTIGRTPVTVSMWQPQVFRRGTWRLC